MNQSLQQVIHVQNQTGLGVTIKTDQFAIDPSISQSRALSKHSFNSNAQQILTYFQSYSPQNQAFVPTLLKLHYSDHLKMKKYREAIYYGDIKNGVKDGVGIMLYNDGRVYEGEWINDLREGVGYQKFPNQCIYKGGYVAGKPQGVGRYSWLNGEFYEGEWQNGMKHGSGMWRGAKGDSYIGQWKLNKADGYGVHTWTNGDRYQGEFKASLKHGQGLQKFANGDIYKGLYSEGKPSGFGQYYWANGSYFKGNFTRGVRNGNGIWKRSQGNSDKYEGEYVNDRKQGYGIFTWASGNVYKGMYDSDQRHGYGQMYWNDGSYYKGEWQHGIQNGEGQIYVPEQGWKKGQFQNNVLVRVDQEQAIQDKHASLKLHQSKAPVQQLQPHQNFHTLHNNNIRTRKAVTTRKEKANSPSVANTTAKTPGCVNRHNQKFTIRASHHTSSTKKNKNKNSLNQRIVIDLSKNYNNPLLPNKFNKIKNRNSQSNERPPANIVKNREKILHSSFYLHRLHNLRNQSPLSDGYMLNPQQNSKYFNSRELKTGSENRRDQQIIEQVRSFNRSKINTFNHKNFSKPQ